MEENKIRELIEQIDPEGKLPPENVEAFIMAVKENEKNPPKDGEVRNGMHFHTLDSLKEQLDRTTNWKERAIIAAKIISLNLE